jgi:hypothetical protein
VLFCGIVGRADIGGGLSDDVLFSRFSIWAAEWDEATGAL